jgi:hypothetical protein
MAADDQPEPEEPGQRGPTRRSVLQAGALGVAAWSVPTIRPIARLAAPGSRPPNRSQSDSSSPDVSVSDSSTTRSSSESGPDEPASDGPNSTDPQSEDSESVGGLHVSGPAKPVTGEPDFTG